MNRTPASSSRRRRSEHHSHSASRSHRMVSRTPTLSTCELPAIDSMPVCHMEDGSDVDPAILPCIWTNDGNAWLTYEDHSLLIVDDTVR